MKIFKHHEKNYTSIRHAVGDVWNYFGAKFTEGFVGNKIKGKSKLFSG